MKSFISRKLLLLALTCAALVASGCASTYVPPDYTSYYWPKEPQKTRLRLLNIINTDLDVRDISQAESLFGETAEFAFIKPNGIAVDNEGTIYVADTYRRIVIAINPETGLIKGLQKPGGWVAPFGLAIDNVNKLLGVSEGNKVYIFDYSTGRMVRSLTKEGFRSIGDVAFDPLNRYIYVVDTKASSVYKYNYNGERLSTVATIGAGEKNVYYPGGADVDGEGRLFIADTMNWKIKIFDKDGNFIRAFGEHGSVPGQFNRPKGISISKDGIIVVTDTDLGMFMLMNDKGQTYAYLGGTGGSPAKFVNPTGVYVDDKDVIYVVDQTNRRVQIFQMYTDKHYGENPRTTGGEDPATNSASDEETTGSSQSSGDQQEKPEAEKPQGDSQQ